MEAVIKLPIDYQGSLVFLRLAEWFQRPEAKVLSLESEVSGARIKPCSQELTFAARNCFVLAAPSTKT